MLTECALHKARAPSLHPNPPVKAGESERGEGGPPALGSSLTEAISSEMEARGVRDK